MWFKEQRRRVHVTEAHRENATKSGGAGAVSPRCPPRRAPLRRPLLLPRHAQPTVAIMRMLILLLAGSSAIGMPTSFSCAVSQLKLLPNASEHTLCTQHSAGAAHNHISFQWMTGSFQQLGEGCEMVRTRIYIDGETAPSISFMPYELAGIASFESYKRSLAEPKKTWSSQLWGRNSETSWTNSFAIPFAKSIRIAFVYTGPSNASAVIYYQAHGLLDSQASFGAVPLPAAARLVIQRSALTLPRLAYLNVSQFHKGAGLVAALALGFSGQSLATLEGCFHFYSSALTPYPGQLHSTGTEDEFLSVRPPAVVSMCRGPCGRTRRAGLSFSLPTRPHLETLASAELLLRPGRVPIAERRLLLSVPCAGRCQLRQSTDAQATPAASSLKRPPYNQLAPPVLLVHARSRSQPWKPSATARAPAGSRSCR